MGCSRGLVLSVALALLLLGAAHARPSDRPETLEAMRARLLALESEASEMRRRLETYSQTSDNVRSGEPVAEVDRQHIGQPQGPPGRPEATAQEGTEDTKGLGEIFATLCSELASLGPELAVELALITPVGILAYLVSKQRSLPKQKGMAALKMSACQPPAAQDVEEDTTAQERIAREQQHKMPKQGPMWRLRGLREAEYAKRCASQHVQTIENSACEGEPVGVAPEPSSSACSGLRNDGGCQLIFEPATNCPEAGCVKQGPQTLARSSWLGTTKIKDADCSACLRAGSEEGTKEQADMKEDGTKDHGKMDSQKTSGEPLPAQQTSQLNGQTETKETSELPVGASMEVVASGEPKAELAAPSLQSGSDSKAVSAANQAARPRKRKEKAVLAQSRKLAEPLDDDWEVLAGTQGSSTGFLRQIMSCICLSSWYSWTSSKSDDGLVGTQQQQQQRMAKHRSRKQQKSSNLQKTGTVGTKACQHQHGCHWPFSLSMTLALSAMLSICLLGRVWTPGPSLTQKSEQLDHMLGKATKLQDQLGKLKRSKAMAKLDLFRSEAIDVIRKLPAEDSLVRKLEGYRTDAKNLREALEEVPDADFPQIGESYLTVTQHWNLVLSKARAQLEGSCAT